MKGVVVGVVVAADEEFCTNAIALEEERGGDADVDVDDEGERLQL